MSQGKQMSPVALLSISDLLECPQIERQHLNVSQILFAWILSLSLIHPLLKTLSLRYCETSMVGNVMAHLPWITRANF